MDKPLVKKEVTLLDYLIVLIRWRKWLAINFIAVCLVAATIAFLMPKWYQATATILPPKKDVGMFGLSSMLGNLPLAGLDFLKGSEDVMIYMAILKSRTVMESVINRFHLLQVYDVENIEKALKKLSQNVEINLEKEGIVSLSVLDKDPDRSAALANAFVHFLDSINVELNIQKARNNRIFLEKRFTQNKEDLRRAEEELKAFQKGHGAIALSAQTEAAIKGAAELLASIMATEVKLGIKEKSLSPTHEEVIQARNTLAELRKKLDEMKYGKNPRLKSGNGAEREGETIFIPFANVPEVGLEFARRFRELEVQKKLFEFLAQQYEQARLQEIKDVPTVQVLDKATPPLRKAKPKRMTIILLSGISATLIFILIIFVLERLRLLHEENPEKYYQVASLFPFLRKAAGYE